MLLVCFLHVVCVLHARRFRHKVVVPRRASCSASKVRLKHNNEAEIALFRALIPLFQQWLPADVVSFQSTFHYSKSSAFRLYPVMYGAFFHAKEFEFRDLLVKLFLVLPHEKQAIFVADHTMIRL